MAKIAICGYGSRGQGVKKDGEGYAYVVNDNVRTKQRLQVISTSRAQRKFLTTAVPLNIYNEGSVLGKEAKKEISKKYSGEFDKAYSGAELGASGETLKKDVQLSGLKPMSQYQASARGLAGLEYQKTHPNAQFTKNAQTQMNRQAGETFASYSKKFMKGEQD